jgi:predicted nucleic acid-binding protein
VILLDTSVLSRVFRRRREGDAEQTARRAVEDLIAADRQLGLPGIVLQEVLSGVRDEGQFADLQQKLVAAFSIITADARDHIDAARLQNTCLAAGLSVSGPDCLIATLTMRGEHELFAMDADFDAIAKHAPLRLYEPTLPATAT